MVTPYRCSLRLRYSCLMSTASSSGTSASPPLSGLHLLLTYRCTYKCVHCFVWSGPFQSGTMTLDNGDHILSEARQLGAIMWGYFGGGEAFLYYAILRSGVLRAKEQGFNVGIVTNAYWANSESDALEWLRPLAGSVDDLSISNDGYHGSADNSGNPETRKPHERPPDSLASRSTSSALPTRKRRTYPAPRAACRPVSRPCSSGAVRPNCLHAECRRRPGKNSTFAPGRICATHSECT